MRAGSLRVLVVVLFVFEDLVGIWMGHTNMKMCHNRNNTLAGEKM